MRKLYSLLFILIMGQAAQATHMSGGEIYWTHLGGNQYRITLTIYRDCAGIQLDNDYDLDITSPCGNTTLNVTTPGGVELSQLCDLELPNSTCNGGSLPGIQQYVYTGVVNLPPCDSWTISWTEIYRNNAIVNLQAPGTLEMYIEGVLNNADGPANDSPQFTNTAIPYICLGYPVSYSYGAFDPEGDSLSYEFIGARVGGANPINYTAPFTGTTPITGITLDPTTGLVNFTLNQAGNWVVVVQVNEYDSSGNLIGTIMRDMQFVAYPCSNVPPDPTTGTVNNMSGGAVQTAPYAVQVCESGDFCFDMAISDANANNVLEATSNISSNLPGATFSYTGSNPITCHVCWNAGPGTAGFYPFIVNVNDGACPIMAFQTYVYAIEVIEGLFIDVTTTDESCAGMNNGTASVSIVAGTGPYQYNWGTVGATTPSITVGAGSYPVQVTDANGCVATPETALIGTTLPPTANAGNDVTACYGSWPIAVSGGSTNAQSVSWSGGGGMWSGTGANMFYTPSAAEIAGGGANVVFNANANGSCPDATDALHINISNSFLNATITPDNVNCNGAADGTATYTPDLPGNTYTWNTSPAQTGATANGLSAGNYSVTATDALGCSTSLSSTITQPTAIAISNIAAVNETCVGTGNGSLTVTATGGTPPYSYAWSNGATTATMTAGAGNYSVNVSDANGCAAATGAGTIGTTQPPTANAGNDLVACYNTWPIALNGSATNAQSSGWSGGSGTWSGSGSTMQYTPSAAEISAGGLIVTFTAIGNSTCPSVSDLLHISISDLPVGAAVSADDANCNGTSDGSATFTPNSTGNTYLWNTTPPQTGATANGLPAGTYSVTVTDDLGCSLTLNTTIAQPQPLVITGLAPVNESCAGSGNGSLSATVIGGTAPY
ncbi:MAG: SprB repeat-containing protein, partial [Flavobacteriales bacterium]|nr:SprB repeat-containing protein [Flavobacteriales bacterium]